MEGPLKRPGFLNTNDLAEFFGVTGMMVVNFLDGLWIMDFEVTRTNLLQ